MSKHPAIRAPREIPPLYICTFDPAQASGDDTDIRFVTTIRAAGAAPEVLRPLEIRPNGSRLYHLTGQPYETRILAHGALFNTCQL